MPWLTKLVKFEKYFSSFFIKLIFLSFLIRLPFVKRESASKTLVLPDPFLPNNTLQFFENAGSNENPDYNFIEYVPNIDLSGYSTPEFIDVDNDKRTSNICQKMKEDGLETYIKEKNYYYDLWRSNKEKKRFIT